MLSIIIEKEDFEVNCLYKSIWDSYPSVREKSFLLKRNEHKSYAWVFGVICTFQSSQFFDRLSMHFGVVYHFRASALTTADRLLGIE
jgi:hypothetical protein